MSRLIDEIRPKAVMVENVPGLGLKGKKLFQEFLNILTSLNYEYELEVLQVADYGIPQSRRRLVVLAGKKFSISIPTPTHTRVESNGRRPWKTIRNVLEEMEQPITLTESLTKGGPQAFNSN